MKAGISVCAANYRGFPYFECDKLDQELIMGDCWSIGICVMMHNDSVVNAALKWSTKNNLSA